MLSYKFAIVLWLIPRILLNPNVGFFRSGWRLRAPALIFLSALGISPHGLDSGVESLPSTMPGCQKIGAVEHKLPVDRIAAAATTTTTKTTTLVLCHGGSHFHHL